MISHHKTQTPVSWVEVVMDEDLTLTNAAGLKSVTREYHLHVDKL